MTNTDAGVRLKYRILYNNGIEDVFIQPVDEDNFEKIQEISEIISEAFEGDASGQIKLGDGIKSIIVKLSDVSRVGIEAIVEGRAIKWTEQQRRQSKITSQQQRRLS